MTPSHNELEAILRLRRLMKEGHPDMATFIHWLADRMVMVYGEDSHMDFVQATRRYANGLCEIEHLLQQ